MLPGLRSGTSMTRCYILVWHAARFAFGHVDDAVLTWSSSFGLTAYSAKDQIPVPIDYRGHNYTGHNYMGHNYMGHNYTGHNYIGDNRHPFAGPFEAVPPSLLGPALVVPLMTESLPGAFVDRKRSIRHTGHKLTWGRT